MLYKILIQGRNRENNMKFIFAITFLLTFLIGCGQETKPKAKSKTIKEMATFLEKKLIKLPKQAGAGDANCLSKDLFPPNYFPQHIEYAGFYFSSATNSFSQTIQNFEQGIDEIYGQGNVTSIAYLDNAFISSSIDHDQLFINKLIKAKSKGFKVLLEIPLIFFSFDTNKNKFNLNTLRSDYKSRWLKFKNIISPYLTSIAGFYPFDEPFWNAQANGISSASMLKMLEEIGNVIKSDLPQIPIIFIEAYPMITSNLKIPKNWDWIGMDCYGSFDKCGLPGNEKSIPEYYNLLKTKIHPHQRLILVPDAFVFTEMPTLNDQLNVVKIARKFLEWAESETLLIGIFPFIYTNLPAEKITGAREMCLVKEFYKQYLSLAKDSINSNLTRPTTPPNAKISISCPATAVAGSTLICEAFINGILNSGFWTIDGDKFYQSENKVTLSWENPTTGKHTIMGVGKDEFGNTILSNKLDVSVVMPAVYCLVPLEYTVINCSKSYEPYTPGTICNYLGPYGSGVATCGHSGQWF